MVRLFGMNSGMVQWIALAFFITIAGEYNSANAFKFVAGGDSRDDMTSFGKVISAEAMENPALSLHDGDCWGSLSSTSWVNVIKGNSVMNALLNANNYLVSRGNHESFSALQSVSPTVVRNNSETYSFTVGNCFFVCAGYDNASYIQSQMTSAAAIAARWRFVWQHVNVYSTGSHASNGYAAVESACDAGNVTMLINGHDHTYERTKLMRGRVVVSTPSNVYNMSQTPGTVYMTNGLGGAPIYSMSTGQSWAAAQYNSTYAYSVIDARTDTCYVTTKNVSGTVIDQFKFVYAAVGPTYTLSTSATNGSISLNPSGGSYASGTVVTVTATPNSGYLFGNWSGDLSGSTNPTTITMNANKSVTANFTVAPPNLARGKTATASSAESANPAGNGNDGSTTTRWCASGGTVPQWWSVDLGSSYNLTGSKVMFESAANYKYKIEVSNDNSTWTLAVDKTASTSTAQTQADNFTGTGRYVRITYTGLASGTWASHYEFEAYGTAGSTYTLTTSAMNGTITLNPAGGTYSQGTVVTVTATANSGYAFSSWSGDITGTTNPTTITMNANKSVTANFTVASTNLALKKTATASSAETANPAANGNDGSTSTRWCASSGTVPAWWMVDLGSSYNLASTKVMFESAANYKYKIEVSTDNSTWILAVDKTASTSTAQTVTDNFAATGRYVRITYTALASGKWASHFEFEVYGTSGPTYTLTTSATNGIISLNPSGGSYASGTVVTVTATASTGYAFSGWSGDLTGTTNPTTITMNASKSVTANFVTAPPNTNVALKKTATASSFQSTNPVQSGNDGSTTTRWCASSGTVPAWWMVDLGSSYNLTGTKVMFESAANYKYKIEVSADNSTWTLAVDKTASTSTAQTVTDNFAATGRYVRITYTGLASGRWASHFEFEAYGAAAPPPVDNQTSVLSSGITGKGNNFHIGISGNNVITVSGAVGTRYMIHDISGKVIMQGTVSSSQEQLVSPYRMKGVYIVKIISRERTLLQKLIAK
jgi:uncharacterized repeat protein (TIGR02543 family)